MWIKTIPKHSKGSHNELGLYIYNNTKKKKNNYWNFIAEIFTHTKIKEKNWTNLQRKT